MLKIIDLMEIRFSYYKNEFIYFSCEPRIEKRFQGFRK